MDRRDFLHQSAALAAATVIPNLGIAEPATQSKQAAPADPLGAFQLAVERTIFEHRHYPSYRPAERYFGVLPFMERKPDRGPHVWLEQAPIPTGQERYLLLVNIESEVPYDCLYHGHAVRAVSRAFNLTLNRLLHVHFDQLTELRIERSFCLCYGQIKDKPRTYGFKHHVWVGIVGDGIYHHPDSERMLIFSGQLGKVLRGSVTKQVADKMHDRYAKWRSTVPPGWGPSKALVLG